MLSFEEIAEIWDAHAGGLLLILRTHGEFAEDAVQEAFLALARQEQLPESPLAWLVTVARNYVLQQQRSNQRRDVRQRAKELNGPWFAENGSQRMLEAQEAVEALQQLSGDDAEILMMHVWGEMTFEQIAAIVGSSRATVHRRYAAALAELRAKLGGATSALAILVPLLEYSL